MSELMGYMRLNEAFQYVRDEFLDIVEEEKRKKKKRPMWSVTGIVAACICVLLLPVGVIAARWFGLWDFLIKEDNPNTYFTAYEFFQRKEVWALNRWEEFLAGYDMDGAILSEAMENGFAVEGREDWSLYGVYSYEMGEMLDDIARRSGLALHHTVDNITFEELKSRVGGSFMEDVDIEGLCQVYEYGSIYFKGNAKLGNYGNTAFEFHCVVKGTFDDTLPLWRDYGSLDEWQYDAACGESVRLALGESHGMILTETDDRICLVVVPNGRENGITEESLQELADKVDFVMLKEMELPEVGRDTLISNLSVISLQGYTDSPESQALVEWEEFLDQYNAEHPLSLFGNILFIAEGREDWQQYSVWDYEMGEKLDEIAEKYGLKLHTTENIIDSPELMYRVGGDFMDEESLSWAYIYEDGYFGAEGEVELSGCGMTSFQFTRSVKGTFNDVTLNIGQVGEFVDWQYTTACGEPVLLAMGPYKALIFADYEECFISVNVLLGSEEGITEENLQELADQIDFRILKDVQVPDMRGDSE